MPLSSPGGAARGLLGRSAARLLLACAASWALTAGHAEAQRLPSTVTPSHYDLTFDIDLAGARFGGDETIEVMVATLIAQMAMP